MAVLQTGSRHRKNVNERSAMQMTAVFLCAHFVRGGGKPSTSCVQI